MEVKNNFGISQFPSYNNFSCLYLNSGHDFEYGSKVGSLSDALNDFYWVCEPCRNLRLGKYVLETKI